MTLEVQLPPEVLPALPREPETSEAELFLVERLQTGRAALPLLPKVASKALHLANSPNSSVAEFAELVQTDPPIAARFVANANSALYFRGNRIKSVHDAVARIGLSGARDLVFQVVYASSVGGMKRYQKAVRESFRQSVACAVLCRVLAQHLELDVAEAYLCGLLHDIGEARVFRILSNAPRPCSEEAATRLVRTYHTRAGAELALKWALPDEIVQTCRKHAEDGPPASDEIRLVRLADLLVRPVWAMAKGEPVPDTWELPEELGVAEGPAFAKMVQEGAEVLAKI